MEKVRIALVGAGSIGRIHARNIKTTKDAELAAICDIKEERAKSLSEEMKVNKIYTNYEEMIDKEQPDGVVVAVPNYLHSSVTVYALSKGANVLCEKPMAINSKEAEKMVEAYKKYNKTLMLGMTQRFTCEAQMLKKLIEQGELGEIYFAKADLLRRLGIPGMGSWFTTKKYSGGGPLIDLGPHMIDLTTWLIGFPKPKSAKGYTFSKIGVQNKGLGGWGIPEPGGPFDVEDLAVGLVEFERGITLYVQVSWATYTDETFNVNIFGNKAGASYHPPKIVTEVEGGNVIEKNLICQQVDPYKKEIEHFVNVIRGKEAPLTAPEEGLTVMKIIDAIYASAEKDKEVKIE
ncbi:Gfo/Idh/MocA family oxidoreductase [archaeon]|nr:Gfo/Idh/MocA family oxidoreductase [archaeon]